MEKLMDIHLSDKLAYINVLKQCLKKHLYTPGENNFSCAVKQIDKVQ
jgi:hypothetical protein